MKRLLQGFVRLYEHITEKHPHHGPDCALCHGPLPPAPRPHRLYPEPAALFDSERFTEVRRKLLFFSTSSSPSPQKRFLPELVRRYGFDVSVQISAEDLTYTPLVLRHALRWLLRENTLCAVLICAEDWPEKEETLFSLLSQCEDSKLSESQALWVFGHPHRVSSYYYDDHQRAHPQPRISATGRCSVLVWPQPLPYYHKKLLYQGHASPQTLGGSFGSNRLIDPATVFFGFPLGPN